MLCNMLERGFMNAADLRNKNLPDVCELLGLERDPADKNQWRGNGRITLNGFAWFDHDAGKGSGGAVDLVMHVLDVGFKQAAAWLETGAAEIQERQAVPAKIYVAPPKAAPEHRETVTRYLKSRGISTAIIEWLFIKGLLYADKYSNCVFMYGAAACELRGTGAVQWRSSRGQFTRGFIIQASNCAGVAVLESAIDAISYRQLHKNHFVVSIGGNSNDAILAEAAQIAAIKGVDVIAAFDNDNGGDIATTRLNEIAIAKCVGFRENRPTNFKDWNDQLRSNL